MSAKTSQLIKRENAIRRRKSLTTGAGVKHRTNCLSTLSSLHSHTSSAVKRNKSLSLTMNKPMKTVSKKRQEKYVIQLGNQQFMQQFSKTGGLVVKEGEEDNELQNLTLQQKIKFFFVLLMIPSAMVVFFGNNKFRDSGNTIDPNIQLSHLGGMAGMGGFPGAFGGGGGGFGGGGYPAGGFDGGGGRGGGGRDFHDRMRSHYDPESIQDHLNRLDPRLRNREQNSQQRYQQKRKESVDMFNDESEGIPPPLRHSPHLNSGNEEEMIKKFLNPTLDSDSDQQNAEKREDISEDSNKMNERKEQIFEKKSIETSSEPEVPKVLLSETQIPNTVTKSPDVVQEHKESGLKTIVLWTPMDDWVIDSGNQPFIDAKCVVNKCFLTTDKSFTNKSNAIVFNARHIAPTAQLPNMRSKHQKWIFFSRLSPLTMRAQDLNSMLNLFNWSWTYRSDSDIVYNYATVEERSVESNQLFKASDIFYIWRKKTKMILWFDNTCHSNDERVNYVNQLKTYIDIDIVTNCSDVNPNAINIENQSQLKELSENYLFVIAFENNYCKDFVSETLYLYLEHSIIPIVHSGMGGTLYSKIVATNSVINANDFTSAKDLADYVLDIGSDFQKYKKYFEWKRNHQIRYERKDLCQLCYKLHEEDNRFNTYSDIKNWWFDGSQCQL